LQLGLFKKISLGLILAIAAAFIVISITGWKPEIQPINLGLSEDATIQKVTFDRANNNLLLDVQSMDSKTIVFNVAIIENSNHETVATIVPFHAELPAYNNTAIIINLNDINLAIGNYTVNLRTANSYRFYSPYFAMP
jgi:hypothetical protein